MAASVQSAVYGGATSGAFSALTSAGAAGIAGTSKIAIGAAGAATAAGVVAPSCEKPTGCENDDE